MSGLFISTKRLQIQNTAMDSGGHTVVQLVEALCYKSEGFSLT